MVRVCAGRNESGSAAGECGFWNRIGGHRGRGGVCIITADATPSVAGVPNDGYAALADHSSAIAVVWFAWGWHASSSAAV